MRVEIRPARVADVEGIREIHAGCDDPWADLAECAIWVNHRLLRGFFIDIATIGERIVGHAEWILSDEPAPYGRHLYLGMIQVHSDYQRQGVGRAMIDAGVHRARALSCVFIRVVPEDDAKGFYRKCGFSFTRRTATFSAKWCSTERPTGWVRSRVVPQNVVHSLPMRFGWVQGSSAHMWELCNRPVCVAGEMVQHPCARRLDGMAYVQLRYLGNGNQAMALAWAPLGDSLEELISAAMALGGALPVEHITFTVEDKDESCVISCCDVERVGADEVWSKPLG